MLIFYNWILQIQLHQQQIIINFKVETLSCAEDKLKEPYVDVTTTDKQYTTDKSLSINNYIKESDLEIPKKSPKLWLLFIPLSSLVLLLIVTMKKRS